MGSRTMPTECPHGRIVDWGDFGPDPDDGTVGAEACERCGLGPARASGPFVVAGVAASSAGRWRIASIVGPVYATAEGAQVAAERWRRGWVSARALGQHEDYIVCQLSPLAPIIEQEFEETVAEGP